MVAVTLAACSGSVQNSARKAACPKSQTASCGRLIVAQRYIRGVVFAEGAVAKLRLTGARNGTPDAHANGTSLANTKLPAGHYTLHAVLRPCDANCSHLDAPIPCTAGSLQIAARRTTTATVVIRQAGSCHITTTPAYHPSTEANGEPPTTEQLYCRQEITRAQASGGPIRPGPHDLVIGPLSFPNGQRLGHMRPQDYGANGSYKIPPVLAPGATVTIAIARPARSYVVMNNPQAPRRGVVAATYHGCRDAWGFFPQSFTFTDHRIRGCVPMDITVAEQRPRRVVLSLFAGKCRT
ncbi:MAG: hypothetical protein ACRDNS_23470 [Trebonia sp.]